MIEQEPKKLHVAVFPWLAYGHILPFFELAKQIAQKGHKVSFISTPRNIHRLSKLPPNLQPFVELIELSLPRVDELPENAEATMDIPYHIVPFLQKAFDGLEQPLTMFLNRSTPDCIIYDFGSYWLPQISSKLGILSIYFNICSAFGTSFILSNVLANITEFPNQALLQKFEHKNISAVHYVPNESGVSDVSRFLEPILGADVFATRSCMEIEGESLKSIENHLCKKPVIPVGLLPPSLQFNEDSNDDNWDKIQKWLDKQEKGSVIYVAFGDEVPLSKEHFDELAIGLEQSGFPYFWVVNKQNIPANSDFVESQDDGIENMLNKQGVLWRTWAPQMRILAHKSIGGFFTHGGWRSVIESLQVGCPLIMLPFQNEQGLVARFMEGKKVGIKVPRNEDDGNFTRDSVSKSLRLVMLEEEGKAYRRQAEEMSKIFCDTKLHQKYVDDFVHYLETHRPAIKH
ncbi:hypothetical protein RIF29_16408 [Crotalaria pallida]|uniref:Glycosyltransferase n=1 Tax=Crotalaria pallida TaxID=3830 RepID=A0AAN9FIU2_CROPI